MLNPASAPRGTPASRADEARGRVMTSLATDASSKPGLFYKACMDLAAIRTIGVSPAATLIRNSMCEHPTPCPLSRDLHNSLATRTHTLARTHARKHASTHNLYSSATNADSLATSIGKMQAKPNLNPKPTLQHKT